MFELSKQFLFDSAHTLERSIDSASSRRIHGHSYRAEITVRGRPDPTTGMIVDLGLLEQTMANVRVALDHRFLDEINDLGPATMENLCRWIWVRLRPDIANLAKVSVFRDSSGEACSYWGDEVEA
jgi:6-pyruvoyltetrahydropterin/6-carboxytetrahydropterin synthase